MGFVANKIAHRDIRTVFIAKGIGIILVVFGHYIPSDSPVYWITLNDLIYKFHMPLFFLLSGYLFVDVDVKNYFLHVKKKVERLLLPFMSIAVLVFIIKYLLSLYTNLKATTNPVTINNVVQLFICPISSYMPLLWFIYTLFIIFLLYPLLAYLLKNKVLLLFCCLVLLSFPAPSFLCLNMVLKNLSYFTLGTFLSSKIDLDRNYDKTKLLLAIILSCIFFLSGFYAILPKVFGSKYIFRYVELIIGVAGITMCISLSMLINQYWNSVIANCLGKVGVFSMSIYLLHTLFAGAVKVIFYQVLYLDSMLFEIKALIAITSGVVFPLLLEKYILRKNLFTRKFILGLTK